MKHFSWTVKLTDTRTKPPRHHGWRSAWHPALGPVSPPDLAKSVAQEIRKAGLTEEQIRGADWQLEVTDRYDLMEGNNV